ncbi:MAG: helix-turn-helix domain-containing protein [Gammaproteobacteria bacterium]
MSLLTHLQTPVLKEDDAAAILNIEVATLRRWRWAGKGPRFIKVGHAVRYDQADLEAFIRVGRRRSTSESAAGDREL